MGGGERWPAQENEQVGHDQKVALRERGLSRSDDLDGNGGMKSADSFSQEVKPRNQ